MSEMERIVNRPLPVELLPLIQRLREFYGERSVEGSNVDNPQIIIRGSNEEGGNAGVVTINFGTRGGLQPRSISLCIPLLSVLREFNIQVADTSIDIYEDRSMNAGRN